MLYVASVSGPVVCRRSQEPDSGDGDGDDDSDGSTLVVLVVAVFQIVQESQGAKIRFFPAS